MTALFGGIEETFTATLLLVELLFLALFIYRNATVARRVAKPIRRIDPLVGASIVLTASILVVAFLNRLLRGFELSQGFVLPFVTFPYKVLGLLAASAAVGLGVVASSHLGRSWRVGVLRDQTTELVEAGLYRWSRNPYFLSYFLLFGGLFLTSPTRLLGSLCVLAFFVFDTMVRREERYLESIHGERYRRYRSRVRRYLGRFPVDRGGGFVRRG